MRGTGAPLPKEPGGQPGTAADWQTARTLANRWRKAWRAPVLYEARKGQLWRRFAVAILAVALGVAIRIIFLGDLGSRLEYITFYAAVTVAALAGGLPAGALATVVSATIATFWIDPTPLSSTGDALGLTIFLFTCVLINGAAAAMHRAQARAIRAEERAWHVAAVRESEDRLALFFAHAPLALAMFDRDMRYVAVSQRWLADYGLQGHDLRGMSHYEVFPETPERWKEVHRRALNGEVIRAEEDRAQRPNGHLCWLRWEVRPCHDAEGQIGGIVIFSEDITDRKNAEIALRDEKEHLNAVFEATVDAIFTIDESGIIQSANHAALHLFGYEEQELIGQNVRVLMPEPHRSAHDRYLQNYLTTGKAKIIGIGREVEALRKDGTRLAVELSVGEAAHGASSLFVGVLHDVTERRRLELERQKFVSLADHSLEFIGICDTNFNPFYVNPAGLRLAGLENLAAACHVKVQDYFFPEDQPFITNEFFPKVLAEGHGEVEIRFRHFKTGEAIWMLYNVFNLTGAKGAVIAWATVSRNITGRKRAEMALKEREGHLRAVFEATVDAIFTIDEKGIIQSANCAALRLFGYEEQELIGQNVRMLMPEPHRSAHDLYLQNYLTTGKAKIIGIGREVEALCKDGTRLTVELSVGEAAHGASRLFVGVLHDVTERKRAAERQLELLEQIKRSEAEARSQQALFRSVFDSAPEGILLIDEQHRIVTVNPALSQIFGYEQGEIAGFHCSFLYEHPEEWQPFRPEAINWASAEAEVVSCRRKNGEVFPGETIRAPHWGPGGKLLGYLRIIRDVTKEQRREAERRQAQRLEALGQLTGGIAHDFNNMLTVISGNLQLAGLNLKNEQLKPYLGEAERAVDMAGRLSQRLMTFAQQRQLVPVPADLNGVIKHMLELLERTLGGHISISTALAENLDLALVDPGEIENAVLNLAINARDAMPGGGKLIIETENILFYDRGQRAPGDIPPGSYVRLTVSDTGSGMPPAVLAKAFEPFFTTKGPGKGTGLGLASIYGFVKQSGGHIRLCSELGHGTTVNIYLPRLQGAAPASVPSREAAAAVEGKGETILVVEDDPDVRRVTVSRLESLGYNVLEAENARWALGLLEAGAPIDLVLSDVILPGGMSGFDLARAVRKLRPRQRLILTSGFTGEFASPGEQDEVRRLLKLRKPYSHTELSREIRAALES